MSETPESWAQTERKKRDKRENSIIENWDNRILRKAQRAYESCGDSKLIIDFNNNKFKGVPHGPLVIINFD